MKSLILIGCGNKLKICAWSGHLLVVVVKRNSQRLVRKMKKKKRAWEVDDYQPRYSKVGLVITSDRPCCVECKPTLWNFNLDFNCSFPHIPTLQSPFNFFLAYKSCSMKSWLVAWHKPEAPCYFGDFPFDSKVIYQNLYKRNKKIHKKPKILKKLNSTMYFCF